MSNGLPQVINSNKKQTNNQSNFHDRKMPSAFGIYTLNANSNVGSQTQIPQYVNETLTECSPNVVFYSTGNAGETAMEMEPRQFRSYWDYKTRSFTTEFFKETGSGTINAVTIGRAHNVKDTNWLTSIKPFDPENNTRFEHFQRGGAPYFLEHKADGSVIYKCDDAVTYQLSLTGNSTELSTTKLLRDYINSDLFSGGLVIGGHVFKAVRAGSEVVRETSADDIGIEHGGVGVRYVYDPCKSDTGITGTIQGIIDDQGTVGAVMQTAFATIDLHYIKDWTDGYEGAEGKLFVRVPVPVGYSVDAASSPVMVYTPEADSLELYLSVSNKRLVGGAWGYRLLKVIFNGISAVNLDDQATPFYQRYSVVDVGHIPYRISGPDFVENAEEASDESSANYEWTGYLHYITGYADGANVYLPYTTQVKQDAKGNEAAVKSGSFVPGIILSDTGAEQGKCIFKSVGKLYAYVLTDGGVVQCDIASDQLLTYVWFGEVLSGTTLPVPVTKDATENIKITYTYSIA
jgi:hypothetical protein